MPDNALNDDGLPIGELARLTGISTHTLRVWEKRYGTPVPFRLPSGHRRYPKDEVPRLRAVARALKEGHRPRKLAKASLSEIESLLNVSSLLPGSSAVTPNITETQFENSRELVLESWIEAVHKFSYQTLDNSFFEEWAKAGGLSFINQLAVPFLNKVGRGWETGEISISQEHFASERLYDFLGSKWRQLNERNDGAKILITSLPGDNHNLGLQMAATLASICKYKVVFIGSDTPCEEIFSAVLKTNSDILCLGVSCYYDKQKAAKFISNLRERIKKEVKIIVGGKGYSNSVPGVARADNFQEFFQYLLDLNKESAKP
jgi:DNA-binding transcriptional MerR regulator/methylmalonyl-CoA mutase cobalamin-binding subunit